MSNRKESSIAGIGTHWSKSYGDTNLGYGASAHLGDVSQDVHIHGDLHVNVTATSDGTTAAATITSAIFCGSRALLLALELADVLVEPVPGLDRSDSTPISTKIGPFDGSRPERTPEAISSQTLKELKTVVAQMRFHFSFFNHITRIGKSEQVKCRLEKGLHCLQDVLTITGAQRFPHTYDRYDTRGVHFAELTSTSRSFQINPQCLRSHYQVSSSGRMSGPCTEDD